MIVRTVLKAKTNKQVFATGPGTLVSEAAHLLHEHRIGALLVTDDQSQIQGILSERDIARGLALHGGKVGDMKVRDLMTSAVLVCSPEDTLEHLMEMMTNNRIRHLPVMEHDRLIGMITIGDVVKQRLEEATHQVENLREYVMASR